MADSVSDVRVFSPAAARRIAIAAQGLGRDRPLDAPPASRAQVLKTAVAQGILQIDSVNVLARAHYMPVFSRLGRYDTAHLDDAVWPPTGRSRRVLLEAWAHEASMVPLDVYRNLWWRRRDLANGRWGGGALIKEYPNLLTDVLDVITAQGPMSAGQVEKELLGTRGEGGWWGWSSTKRACEVLFAAGRIVTSYRRGFERFYDLAERVVPPEVLSAPQPDEPDAKRALVAIAAERLGVATLADLSDYFRMRSADTAVAVAELTESGALERVSVSGWREVAYLHTAARVPRRLAGAALLCPFDPMIWFRRRTERLFDFHYRIEIYTPAEKRVHGYYVFPLLMNDALVGRFDLKADRQAGELLVQAAWLEPGHHPGEVAESARTELARLAGWLGLDAVVVKPRGDLALTLAG